MVWATLECKKINQEKTLVGLEVTDGQFMFLFLKMEYLPSDSLNIFIIMKRAIK